MAGCQINPIDVNFQLQKSLGCFDKNSADKNLIQKRQGVENALHMPIRVKHYRDEQNLVSLLPIIQRISWQGESK